ncbi:Pycsar system effector family protein [Pontibacter beigongshangensis]|uniref:Pycsar system effector family protein n=1 Tax=Pontibacter beigongshangensis TaxID=2574733 RepID=UPI001650039E|nr:Pycsar system effector family protein [Pontibacter beigongshangensis]
MIDEDILEKANAFVGHRLSGNGAQDALGDHLKHTRALVAVAEAISKFCDFNEQDTRLLMLGAWLHDLYFDEADELLDEQKLVPVYEFLVSCGLTRPEILRLHQSIATTRYPQQPQDLLDEALCDAVASFLASEDYLRQAEQKAADTSTKIGQYDWIEQHLTLLKKHYYHTKYAKRAFSAGKDKNMKALKKQRKDLSKDNAELERLWEENKGLKRDLKKEKEQKVSKGIETMFRTTMASHLQLSVIADSKANMMISVNAIIASIMISSFFNNFQDVPHLLLPSILLTVVCLLTVIFAIRSTRPNIKNTAVPEHKIDFLFFGDFVQLKPDSYREGIRNIMRDHNLLYNSMADNIYLQGLVLARKYRLLKLSYTVFAFGLGLVLISYIVAWLFLPHH